MDQQGDISVGMPVNDAELRAFGDIAAYAFGANGDAPPDLRWEPERYRLVRVDGRVAGGLTLLAMGQWFGGYSVPMAGIAGVAVAPEYRARGLSSRLLRGTLEEVRSQGAAISTLFPATYIVYRRLGYEQAGVYMRYQLPLHALSHGDRRLTARRATDADLETIRTLYTVRARRTAGNLDRTTAMWDATMGAGKAGLSIFIVARDDVPEGYLIFRQQKAGDGAQSIVIHDLVALTADARGRLLALLADHRSIAGSMIWPGSPADVLMCHLPNPSATVVEYERWMLRIVDVPHALELRGYPPVLEGELHLHIHDEVCVWNEAPGCLQCPVDAGISGAVAAVRCAWTCGVWPRCTADICRPKN